ncbi:hypothetical protein [Serratia marcescens]|uniref:hypothetical protein n=1 Tax=Serratia marcescens TaxID=615 RepID=UPI0013DC1B03|nr:hypothetical protein [Serratia marcescens]
MSFSITRELTVAKSYPELVMQVDDGTEEVAVTYEVISLESLLGSDGVINYTVSIGGIESPWVRQLTFKYSGAGNPLTEGEAALKTTLGYKD